MAPPDFWKMSRGSDFWDGIDALVCIGGCGTSLSDFVAYCPQCRPGEQSNERRLDAAVAADLVQDLMLSMYMAARKGSRSTWTMEEQANYQLAIERVAASIGEPGSPERLTMIASLVRIIETRDLGRPIPPEVAGYCRAIALGLRTGNFGPTRA